MRLRLAWLALAVTAPACLTARTDARIRPGPAIGVTSQVMATPDATTFTPDAFIIGVPEFYDAAPARLIVEPYLAWGWTRAELRLHLPSVNWASRSDRPAEDRRAKAAMSAALDLYVKVLTHGRWHAGLGVETAAAGYAVGTYAWSAGDAASLTLRGVFGGRDGSKNLPRYNTQLQAQVSFVRRTGRFDVSAFVGASTHVGEGDGSLLHAYPQGGESYVTFREALYGGVGVDWR